MAKKVWWKNGWLYFYFLAAVLVIAIISIFNLWGIVWTILIIGTIVSIIKEKGGWTSVFAVVIFVLIVFLLIPFTILETYEPGDTFTSVITHNTWKVVDPNNCTKSYKFVGFGSSDCNNVLAAFLEDKPSSPKIVSPGTIPQCYKEVCT